MPFRYNVAALAATPPDAQTQMLAAAGRNAVKIYRYETLDFRGEFEVHGPRRRVWIGMAKVIVGEESLMSSFGP